VPLPRKVTNVKARSENKGRRISWNKAFDCNGNAVAGYNVYRAASAAGPFSKINTALITDTYFYDTEAGVVISGGGGAESDGYYAVTAVDGGGTESVQSLAVKPAAALSSAAGGAAGCFIRAAGHPVARPYIIILLLFTVVVVLAVWRSPSGARREVRM